jgi:hypothetical protein
MKETCIARNTLALLLLTIIVLSANAGHTKEARKSLKTPQPILYINNVDAVCQKLVKTISDTPNFFDNFLKKGDAYILLESPFKQEKVEEIPPNYFAITAFLNDSLKTLSQASHSFFSHCKDNTDAPEKCKSFYALNSLRGRPATYFDKWLEAAPKDGFFYSMPVHFQHNETAKKMMGYLSHHAADGRQSTYPITLTYPVDNNGMPSPGIKLGLVEAEDFEFYRIPINMNEIIYEMKIVINAKNVRDEDIKKWEKNYFLHEIDLLEFIGTEGLISIETCNAVFFQPKR